MARWPRRVLEWLAGDCCGCREQEVRGTGLCLAMKYYCRLVKEMCITHKLLEFEFKLLNSSVCNTPLDDIKKNIIFKALKTYQHNKNDRIHKTLLCLEIDVWNLSHSLLKLFKKLCVLNGRRLIARSYIRRDNCLILECLAYTKIIAW